MHGSYGSVFPFTSPTRALLNRSETCAEGLKHCGVSFEFFSGKSK